MSTDSKYLTCAETAKLIRVQLAKVFPGQKFWVRSETYSGGASIHISYMDGPTQKDVENVTNPFNGAGFDGMVDYKTSHEAWLLPDGSAVFAEYQKDYNRTEYTVKPHPEARRVSFGSDYIFVNRHFSPAAAQPILESICKEYGIEEVKYTVGKLWVHGKETEIPVLSWDCTDVVFNKHDWLNHTIHDALSNTSFYLHALPETIAATIQTEDITVSWDRDWTWITFPKKPSEAIREMIKSQFSARFSNKRQAWYVTEQVDETTIRAQLAGVL